jgi:conjugative transfer signal peptidase TraF
VTAIKVKRLRVHWFWFASLIGLAVLAASSILFANRQIVINTSPSVPSGLYLRSTVAPAVGRIIDFRIPQAARNYIKTRTGQNGEDWYILKPIVAGPGDRIDTTGEWLLINGLQIAPMPPTNDTGGRSLPIWRDTCVLGPDEFFVFSNRIPNSFDSRCYGPIRRQQIEAVRAPLLTW